MRPSEGVDPSNKLCSAKTIKGKPCKRTALPGYGYCRTHCFGRVKNSPWYQNGLFLFGLSILVAYYFYVEGPSGEKQDQGLTNDQVILSEVKDTKRTVDELARAFRKALNEQARSPTTSSGLDLPKEPKRLNFDEAFQTIAVKYGVTPQEVKHAVETWVANNRASPDLSLRAQAEFLAGKFPESAKLSDQSAGKNLERFHQLENEGRQYQVMAVKDLERAGEAMLASGQFVEALQRFESALTNATFHGEAWVRLKGWVGMSHREVGVRADGTNAAHHLKAAVAAYNDALPGRPRQKYPLEWAFFQNNIAAALRDEAERSEDKEAFELLKRAIGALRDVLTLTPDALDDFHRAVARMNLALSLRDQALRFRNSDINSSTLLSEALAEYEASLTHLELKRFPMERADALNAIGNTSCDLAEFSERGTALRLLDRATSAYREALEIFASRKLTNSWTMAKNNSGTVLSLKAKLVGPPESIKLLREAISIYIEVEPIQKINRDWKYWAITKENIGNACFRLAELVQDPAETEKLLLKAIDGYKDALGIWRNGQFSHNNNETSKKLTTVEKALELFRQNRWPQ